MVPDTWTGQDEGPDVEQHDSDGDDELPHVKHTTLLEAVSQLDGKQRITAPTRSEPSLQVTEFHLVGRGSSGKSKVHVTDLTKVLDKTSSHAEIRRKVKLVQKKSKTLPKPLEKIVSEKVRRSVAFENVKLELGKWEAVVHSNRSVDTLNFPLNQPDNRLPSSNAFIAKLKSQKPTELEAKVAEILAESSSVQGDGKEDDEEDKEYPLSLEELLEHRKEVAKIRALQSYKAAKAVRQKRIKSKKYHRLQRREGVRKQIKNFELLQKSDPEAALKQLEELERARVEERMTLRHRSTGQWARNKAVQAKYDKEARHALAEQLAVSRELTQKVAQEPDSGVDSETDAPAAEQPAVDISSGNAKNPWIVKPTSEVNQFVSGYRKFWEEQNKRKAEETDIAGNSIVNQEMHVNVTNVESGERLKIMENVVERVELLEYNDDQNADDSSSDKDELSEHVSSVLQVQKISMENNCVQSSCEVESNVLPDQDKTVKKKKNKKLAQDIHNADLNIKRKKCKSDRYEKKQRRQTSSSADASCKLTSTSASWVVTEANAPGSKSQSEGRRRGKKTRRVGRAEAKTSHLEVSADMKIDDLFEMAEEKLKQKVRNKVHSLQSCLTEGARRKEESCDDLSEGEVNVAGPSLAMNKSVTRPVMDEELGEVAREGCDQADVVQGNPGELALLSRPGRDSMQRSAAPSTVGIDPNNFLQVKQKFLMSQMPDVQTRGDEAIDDDEEDVEEKEEGEREKLIAEAFADDDVVAEFRDEKEDHIEKTKPKDIDMTLPGWGDWGGPNISVSKRKKRRFIFKVPKDAPRRDDNKGNLIISEDKDSKIKQHQVRELPFPFERVQDFEASIRAPVGRDWVPETAHRKMILPAVSTKLGTVIEPMDENVLFSKKRKRGNKKYFPI